MKISTAFYLTFVAAWACGIYRTGIPIDFDDPARLPLCLGYWVLLVWGFGIVEEWE